MLFGKKQTAGNVLFSQVVTQKMHRLFLKCLHFRRLNQYFAAVHTDLNLSNNSIKFNFGHKKCELNLFLGCLNTRLFNNSAIETCVYSNGSSIC